MLNKKKKKKKRAVLGEMGVHLPRPKIKVRLLFLDVDGVLNYERFISEGNKDQLSLPHLKRVRRIIDYTDCRIVLSTSWRLIPQAKAKLMEQLGRVDIDVKKYIIGETPSLQYVARYHEIDMYLKNDNVCAIYDVISWVAVDDLPLNRSAEGQAIMNGHFVRTSFTTGMTEDDMKEVIALLLHKQVKDINWNAIVPQKPIPSKSVKPAIEEKKMDAKSSIPTGSTSRPPKNNLAVGEFVVERKVSEIPGKQHSTFQPKQPVGNNNQIARKPISEFRKKLKEKQNDTLNVTQPIDDTDQLVTNYNKRTETEISEMNSKQMQEYGFRSEILMDSQILMDDAQ
ncbi:hypothetical protein RFI_26193 [Reticulomyxa filosa]|uniref:Uncharacterized protein n=1 Tax=Reticulomyxa filosa TaxID=46433 RepID=X6MAZ2_RETFI|nr:hypothetical protein RFI_26193 [Reticulomyxa filosa]|eukprot:ETO11183.1 hypothetical protein RFI_26193 [Reticulomyxa filosa]